MWAERCFFQSPLPISDDTVLTRWKCSLRLACSFSHWSLVLHILEALEIVVRLSIFTCSEVDHGCGACCDGVHLRMDLMFGLVHLVFPPGLGCLEQRKKKSSSNKDLELLNSHITVQINPLRLRRKETEAHCICPQWGQGIKVIQRSLGSLDSLHTGVDGSSQGLLCWSLWTQKNTVTYMIYSIMVYNIVYTIQSQILIRNI